MMLLTISTFDPKQTVIPVAEAPTMPCPTCSHGDPIHPEGIWQCNGCGRTYPEYVNGCVEDHAAPRKVVLVTPEICTDCTARRVPFVGRIALATKCPVPLNDRTHFWCEECNGLGYLIVASAHVDAAVPNIPVFAGGWQNPTEPFSLILSDVLPTTERCPACWGTGQDNEAEGWYFHGCLEPGSIPACGACDYDKRCPPIPVAAGPTWREWPT